MKTPKLDQIRINWSAKIWGWGLVPHPCPILCLVIFDNWKTWLKLVMLENLQACFFSIQPFSNPLPEQNRNLVFVQFVEHIFVVQPIFFYLTQNIFHPKNGYNFWKFTRLFWFQMWILFLMRGCVISNTKLSDFMFFPLFHHDRKIIQTVRST